MCQLADIPVFIRHKSNGTKIPTPLISNFVLISEVAVPVGSAPMVAYPTIHYTINVGGKKYVQNMNV